MEIIVEFIIDVLISGFIFALVNSIFYQIINYTILKPIKAIFSPVFNIFKKNKKEKSE